MAPFLKLFSINICKEVSVIDLAPYTEYQIETIVQRIEQDTPHFLKNTISISTSLSKSNRSFKTH